MREISKELKRAFLALKFYDSKYMISGIFCIAGLTNNIVESVLIKASLCFGYLPCLWAVAGRSCRIQMVSVSNSACTHKNITENVLTEGLRRKRGLEDVRSCVQMMWIEMA